MKYWYTVHSKWYITAESTSQVANTIYKRQYRKGGDCYWAIFAQKNTKGVWVRVPMYSIFEKNHIEKMIENWNMCPISEEEVFLKLL